MLELGLTILVWAGATIVGAIALVIIFKILVFFLSILIIFLSFMCAFVSAFLEERGKQISFGKTKKRR